MNLPFFTTLLKCENKIQKTLKLHINYVKLSVKNKFLKQFASLVIVNVIVMGITFAINLTNTRFMSEEDFGSFRYVINYYNLVAYLVLFGVQYSSSRLLAIEKNEINQKEIMGSTLLIVFINCIGSMIITYLLIGIAYLFSLSINPVFFIAAPFSYTLVLQVATITMLQGLNRISDISIQYLIPQVLIFSGTIFVVMVWGHYSFYLAFLLNVAMFSVTHILTVIRIRPSFKNIRSNVRALFKENKTNGFQIYLGAVSSVATTNLISLILGAFESMKNYAYYSLAISLTALLAQLPAMMGMVLYKSSAQSDRIPKKKLIFSFVFSVISLIGFIIFIKLFFLVLFTDRYKPAIPIIFLLSIGAVLSGLGDFFNRFLGAKGKGKMIRNAAFITGTTNIILAIILMPLLGLWGVVLLRLICNILYFSLMLHFYYRSTKLSKILSI